jgi:hypothetical protein
MCSSLCKRNTAALADVSTNSTHSSIACTFLLIDLSGRAFNHTATFGPCGTLSSVGMRPDVCLLKKRWPYLSAKQSFIDLDRLNLLAFSVIYWKFNHNFSPITGFSVPLRALLSEAVTPSNAQ